MDEYMKLNPDKALADLKNDTKKGFKGSWWLHNYFTISGVHLVESFDQSPFQSIDPHGFLNLIIISPPLISLASNKP